MAAWLQKSEKIRVNGSQEKRTIPRNRDDWMIELAVVVESKNANGWYLMSDSPLILHGAG